MTALVTGAGGFLGRHLVRALMQRGHAVRVLVRRPTGLPEDWEGRVHVAVGDIRDAQAVDRTVQGCDQVYHLAAVYRDAGVPKQEYGDVHVKGTEHILEACTAHAVKRLIHCSTIGVHGHVSRIPSDEAAPFNPGDEYQRTKLEAERRVWAVCRERKVPFSIVRPAGIYGPGDLRFLKLFRAIQGGYFIMLGSGDTRYHLAYVDDVVDGFLRCGEQASALGEAFIIGHDQSVTLNEFAALIARVLNVPVPRRRLPVWPVYWAASVCEALCVPLRINPPLHRRRVDFFTHDRAFDIGKARRVLGYQPAVSLEEGLRRTARWYHTQGLLGGRPAGQLDAAVSKAAMGWGSGQVLEMIAEMLA